MTDYITENELRQFLQFDTNDYPTQKDLKFFISLTTKFISLDLETTSENVVFIASLLRAKALVMRGLASRSVRKGYIQVNAEGRTITKSYQEMVLEAENVLQEYKEFILAVDRQEATSTNFFTNTEEIDSLTRQDILDIMNGVNDIEDLQNQFRYNRSRRV